MSKTKGGRRKFAGHTSVHLTVVVRRVTSWKHIQLESFHCLGAYDQRQPFVVDDMLDFCNNYLTRFVEHNFICPMTIQFGQNFSHSIVFTNPNRMKSGQGNDLIGSAITYPEFKINKKLGRNNSRAYQQRNKGHAPCRTIPCSRSTVALVVRNRPGHAIAHLGNCVHRSEF